MTIDRETIVSLHKKGESKGAITRPNFYMKLKLKLRFTNFMMNIYCFIMFLVLSLAYSL